MPPDVDITTIEAERKRHFTPGWFADLLSARLTLGETFWMGMLGVTLVFTPALFVLGYIPSKLLAPPLGDLGFTVLLAIATVYFAVLTIAIFRTARRTPQVGGWRWLGVVIALANNAALAFTVYTRL